MGTVAERKAVIERDLAALREDEGDERTLTVEHVAGILLVTTKTVKKLVATGKLRCKRVGRLLRFKRSWVDDYLNNNRER